AATLLRPVVAARAEMAGRPGRRLRHARLRPVEFPLCRPRARRRAHRASAPGRNRVSLATRAGRAGGFHPVAHGVSDADRNARAPLRLGLSPCGPGPGRAGVDEAAGHFGCSSLTGGHPRRTRGVLCTGRKLAACIEPRGSRARDLTPSADSAQSAAEKPYACESALTLRARQASVHPIGEENIGFAAGLAVAA